MFYILIFLFKTRPQCKVLTRSASNRRMRSAIIMRPTSDVDVVIAKLASRMELVLNFVSTRYAYEYDGKFQHFLRALGARFERGTTIAHIVDHRCIIHRWVSLHINCSLIVPATLDQVQRREGTHFFLALNLMVHFPSSFSK